MTLNLKTHLIVFVGIYRQQMLCCPESSRKLNAATDPRMPELSKLYHCIRPNVSGHPTFLLLSSHTWRHLTVDL